MNKEFLKMQKIAGLITENQSKQLVESLEQDIINFVLELENISKTLIQPVNLGGYVEVDDQTNTQS